MAFIRGCTEHCKYSVTWFVKSRGQEETKPNWVRCVSSH